MGIYRRDYILFGWKLPNKITNENGEYISFWDDKYLPYVEGHPGIEYSIINDQMCGEYTAFGKQIMSGGDYDGWDFEPITLGELNADDVKSKYTELFGTNPPSEPILFIFSNFS
jgi:hypothetical protein